MAVVLALGAAISYGLGDFIGGVTSRRTSPWPVALVGTATGIVGALVLMLLYPGDPSSTALWWGALAGVGNGLGAGFLYRGLSLGRMGVVGPVSAVGAASLPVLAGLLGGERPEALVWLGILIALPAIWLVAREPVAQDGSTGAAVGLLEGLVAGAGFGLLFAALGQVPDGAGYAPILLNQVVGVLAILVIATTGRQPWLPRQPAVFVGGIGSGVLAVMALTGFLLATQQGLLAVSGVLASLYPAFTVLLATVLLKEPIHRTQRTGLAMCVVSVVCVALG